MKERIQALVVSRGMTPLRELERVLKDQSFRISRVHTYLETRMSLRKATPPHLVITDVDVMDGMWEDILWCAQRAVQSVAVILVTPPAELSFYAEAIERGAYGFIWPPFAAGELKEIVRNAALEILHTRRGETQGVFLPCHLPLPAFSQHVWVN